MVSYGDVLIALVTDPWAMTLIVLVVLFSVAAALILAVLYKL